MKRRPDHLWLWQWWAAIALALAAAILGHDLAMAGNAHHAGQPALHERRHRHEDHRPAFVHREPAPGAASQAIHADDSCGVNRVVALTSLGTTKPPVVDRATPLTPVAIERPLYSPSRANPSLPPGVRRAMLQVFRI